MMPIDFLIIKEFCSFDHSYNWFKKVQNCIFWLTIHRNFQRRGLRPALLAVIVAVQCEIVLLKSLIMLTPLGK